ncbi:hypothetical protein [Flavobacterium sp.]|jgi:hypothetical protein|uniref:hypothetical protein n=1 Tax=Flavobacterium sp. TaxID=239 RepID=UPI0037C17776
MKKLNQKLVLEAKIDYLKNKQTTDFYNLKEQYHQTIESFTTINLIKNSFESILKAPNLKANLLNQALNFGVSFITKNAINTNSENPIQGIIGKIIRFALKKISRNKSSKKD